MLIDRIKILVFIGNICNGYKVVRTLSLSSKKINIKAYL